MENPPIDLPSTNVNNSRFDFRPMEKFKSIPELIQSLNQLALRINKGSVGLEEFEVTLRDARELYERLVILRYKAIEDRNLMGMSQQAPPEPEKQEQAPESSEEPQLAPKQISLIDSIEEIAREATPPPAPPAERKEDEPVAKPPEPEAPIADEPEPTPEPPVEKPKAKTPEPPKAPAPTEEPPRQTSLNEAISNSTPANTLADQLSQTKIDDLTVAIGLNQKFQFIKELFDGDSEAYNKAVKTLNNCDSFEDAQKIVENELMKPYDWNEEDRATMVFLNLVERRYQS